MGRQLESFHGFIGQTDIVKSLKEHCAGALSKGGSSSMLPHVLLAGPSGHGKTHLAVALGKEMGVTTHSVFSSPQAKRWQIARDLAKLQKGDIFFVDEIHSLADSVQEIFYSAIDNLRVPVVDAETHRIAENEWVSIPPFTMVAASDQPGKLVNALRQRLVLRFTLSDYDEESLRAIVSNHAAEMKILLSGQAARRIAQAARGVPRRAKHLLQSLHTVMSDENIAVTRAITNRHLASIGIDKDNLTPTDRAYLGVLCRRGGFVSLEVISQQINVDDLTAKREIEHYLIKQELIGIDSRGRYLTEKGKKFVTERKLA